jgi:hypothetical protein
VFLALAFILAFDLVDQPMNYCKQFLFEIIMQTENQILSVLIGDYFCLIGDYFCREASNSVLFTITETMSYTVFNDIRRSPKFNGRIRLSQKRQNLPTAKKQSGKMLVKII